MPINLEVCVDNLESLHNAIAGGADRIELCSSLALGGLTPSYGLMKQAVAQANIPIYAMIRPRQGDFLYSSHDIESMLEDIYIAKQVGVQGIVFGVLTAQGKIDIVLAQKLMVAAKGLGSTFHRAIDQCCDPIQAIEAVAELGCERVLTSGLASSAPQGVETLAKMVKQADKRLSIMAGAGVNAANVAQLIQTTGVREVHLSGKTTRASYMDKNAIQNNAYMGQAGSDDFIIPITDPLAIKAVKQQINDLTL